MLAQADGADAEKGGSVFRARLSITFLAAGAHSLFEVRSCSYSASLDDDHDGGVRVVDFRSSFEGKRRSGDLRRVSFLSACVAGPAAAFPRLWLTK